MTDYYCPNCHRTATETVFCPVHDQMQCVDTEKAQQLEQQLATAAQQLAAKAAKPTPSCTILVYHGKYGDEYWLADTPERMDAARRKLFQMLDEQGFCQEHEAHLAEARAGDAKAIRWILEVHRDYEYEGWDLEAAFDPLAEETA